MDKIFGIHESNTALSEIDSKSYPIHDFITKETFSWSALRRMAWSGGLYSDSLYSSNNLDKLLLKKVEREVFEEDLANQPTVIELLYQLCNIPFKTIIPEVLPEYVDERAVFLEVVLKPSFVHPDCVMEIMDVFKEAIKAILFFSWDGYFSWKKGVYIPFVEDIIKKYVVNNADTNRLY